MEMGRFLISVESKREKHIYKKKKGRKWGFKKHKSFTFLTMKDLLKKKKKSFYLGPLVEGVGYNFDKTKYFVKLGFKRNLVINEDSISVYRQEKKDWLNLRFNFQKSSIAYLFRNKWYLGNKRTRRNLEKRKRYMKWLYSMHYRYRKKEKDFPLMEILKRGVPVQVGVLHSRLPYSREISLFSVLYFLREQFLTYPPYHLGLIPRRVVVNEEIRKKREEEWESHQVMYSYSKYRLKNRLKWARRKMKRKKKSFFLWVRPFGFVTFRKDGRCHS